MGFKIWELGSWGLGSWGLGFWGGVVTKPRGVAASVHHIGNRDAAVALNGLACGALQNNLSDTREPKSGELVPKSQGLGA